MNRVKKMRMSNNELSRNLTSENQKIMTDMVVYLRSSKISDERIEFIRQDLLDIALAAQERSELLSNVFGGDYKLFCDEIIANEKPERFKKFVKGLPYLLSSVAMLGVFGLISSRYFWEFTHDIRTHTAINPNYPISLGFIVNTGLIYVVAVSIVYLIGKFSFKADNFLARFHGMPTMLKFIIGALLGLLIWLYLFGIQSWYGVVVFYINIWVYLSIIIPMFALWIYFFGSPKSLKKGRRV